ncbi:hypothetical protein LIA77_07485 [Sarocladium implicatum]|nr:hypothetical protein LIA77_07485 [Sarocladium implicatum]
MMRYNFAPRPDCLTDNFGIGPRVSKIKSCNQSQFITESELWLRLPSQGAHCLAKTTTSASSLVLLQFLGSCFMPRCAIASLRPSAYYSSNMTTEKGGCLHCRDGFWCVAGGVMWSLATRAASVSPVPGLCCYLYNKVLHSLYLILATCRCFLVSVIR